MPPKPSPPPRMQSKGFNTSSLIWIIVLSFALLYLMRTLTPDSQTERISYSAFKTAVADSRVAEVTFKGNQIFGHFHTADQQKQTRKEDSAPQKKDQQQAEAKVFNTVKPPLADPALLSLLEAKGVKINAETKGSNWLSVILISILPWVLIFGLMFYSARKMRQGMGGGGPGQLFNFGRSNAKQITREQVNVSYDDVAGLENTKKELREIVLYLRDPERFRQLGAELPKGILLVGPPGVGKTLMARATAGEADVAFFSISGSEFIEMFVGVGASRVRDLFNQAKQHSPAIIFVDELDSIGRIRGTGVGGGHDEREQTLNQILSQMDGFSPRQAVIVIAATNRPDVLDPALTRPGRFDRRITLDLPRKTARRQILATHTRNVPLADDVDLGSIAERTVGMSGADLKNLVNEAALLAARREKQRTDNSDFETARDKILMGIEREEVVSDAEREVVAYHEAGHALVAKLLPDADPLQKVTIIARGRALGATEQLPLEDRRNISRKYLLDRIAVLMGGRVAERRQFGEISTGAGNDLKQATQLARRMVCEWGMSDELGPMTFDGSEPHPFLGRKLSESKDFSEHTARLIDDQVRDMLKAQEAVADRLLGDHHEDLDILARALLDHEVVDKEEVEKILESSKQESASNAKNNVNHNGHDSIEYGLS